MQTGCLWGPGEKYHKWMDYVDFQEQQKRPGVKKQTNLAGQFKLDKFRTRTQSCLSFSSQKQNDECCCCSQRLDLGERKSRQQTVEGEHVLLCKYVCHILYICSHLNHAGNFDRSRFRTCNSHCRLRDTI